MYYVFLCVDDAGIYLRVFCYCLISIEGGIVVEQNDRVWIGIVANGAR